MRPGKWVTIRGIPVGLLAGLEASAAENERSLEGEVRYALKTHVRGGWRAHGALLPGTAAGDRPSPRTLTIRAVDQAVIDGFRDFAQRNGCKPSEEVLHALDRYLHGPRPLTVDDLTTHRLAEALLEVR